MKWVSIANDFLDFEDFVAIIIEENAYCFWSITVIGFCDVHTFALLAHRLQKKNGAQSSGFNEYKRNYHKRTNSHLILSVAAKYADSILSTANNKH